MSRVATITAWSLWRQHRIEASCFAFYFVALIVASNTVFRGHDLKDVVGWTLPLMGMGVVLLANFSYPQADLASPHSGFPKYMLALPARTWELVLWPMALGSGTMIGLWVLSAKLVYHPLGADIPLLWPGMMLAMVLTSLQAIVWCPVGVPFLHIGLALVIISIEVAFAIRGSMMDLSPAVLCAVFGMLMVAAYFVAVAGLARARRGDSPHVQVSLAWLGIRRREFLGDRPFSSPTWAQVWYEWRNCGVMLPVLMFFAALLFCGLPFVLRKSARVGIGDIETPLWARQQFVLLFLPLIFAPLASCGRITSKSRRKQLDTLQLTRPLSTPALVMCKYRAAALSTLLSWLIVLGFGCIYLFAPAQSGGRTAPLGYLLYVHATWPMMISLVVSLVLMMVLTWKWQVQGMWIELLGKPWLTSSYQGLVGCVVFMISQSAILAMLGGALNMQTTMQLARVLLTVAVMGKIACAAVLLSALRRRAMISSDHLQIVLLYWFIVTAILFLILYALVPSTLATAKTLALAAVLFVPISRFAAAPLALASARHR